MMLKRAFPSSSCAHIYFFFAWCNRPLFYIASLHFSRNTTAQVMSKEDKEADKHETAEGGTTPKGAPPREFKEKFIEAILSVTFDLVLSFFNLVIHTFFRDIVSRGSFNIPKTDPVIFVIAPHHNQFIDAIVVMTKVREHSGRHASLLIANKSYQRPFIGTCAKLCSAISVERAQDVLATDKGTIKVDGSDSLLIIGEGTQFTKDAMVKGLIGLPHSLGSVQIESIQDDTHLKLKKPFKSALPKYQVRIEKLLKEGTSYKLAPHIDNSVVFSNVFKHLNSGKVLGIFPEGGSHDRPDLLPLKPGVALMALGAVASQLQTLDASDIKPVKVIPVGLNYFHPHKFRSRVVIEFGKPIVVDAAMAEDYKKNSRAAVDKLLETITLHLKEVTVTCDDYDTLMALQAARRLYTSGSRESIPLPLVVEMNRRLIRGYQKHAHEPDVIELKDMVTRYNKELTRYGLHDHQVETLNTTSRLHNMVRFLKIFTKFAIFTTLSLPGVVLFSPVFITASRISHKKAKEALASSTVKIKAKDVLGTWKILVALALAPALYVFYAVIGTVMAKRNGWIPAGVTSTVGVFGVFYLWAVFTTYASLRVGEIGVDYYKSLAPLFVTMVSYHSQEIQVERLKQTRRDLSYRINEFCMKYGPDMFEDYERFYREYNGEDFEDDYVQIRRDSESIETAEETDEYDLDNLADIQIFSNGAEEKADDDEHEDDDEDDDEEEDGREYKQSDSADALAHEDTQYSPDKYEGVRRRKA